MKKIYFGVQNTWFEIKFNRRRLLKLKLSNSLNAIHAYDHRGIFRRRSCYLNAELHRFVCLMDRLPEKCQAPYLLYLSGHTVPEIARLLHIRPGAAWYRMDMADRILVALAGNNRLMDGVCNIDDY